jgi:predicted nucleic acid-binding protein
VKRYYLDTCIWLNLFKKEGDSTKGAPYWKIAKDFLEQIKSDEKVIVSTIVLKELIFTAGDKFELIKSFFKASEFIEIIKTVPEDYDFARKLENEDRLRISFYDYLHIAIAKRINALLITRDKDLITKANKLIQANKPEELIN